MVRKYTESFYYQIKLTEKLCKMWGKQIEESLDLPITIDEMMILSIIKENNGEIHQRDLAQMIFRDRANTGKLLNILEEQGFITRIDATKNKRQAKVINITEKGEDMITIFREDIEPMFAKIKERTSKEDEEIAKKYLQSIRDAITGLIELNI